MHRYCPDRCEVGGVCLSLKLMANGMGCSRWSEPTLCIVEAERSQSRGFLSPENQYRLAKLQELGLIKPTTAVVILPPELRPGRMTMPRMDRSKPFKVWHTGGTVTVSFSNDTEAYRAAEKHGTSGSNVAVAWDDKEKELLGAWVDGEGVLLDTLSPRLEQIISEHQAGSNLYMGATRILQALRTP